MAQILAFAGSLREHSYTKRIVGIAAEGARETGSEVTLIDLRDYAMPIYDADDHEKNGFPENALKFQQLLNDHNGFLICTPEYNGSVPGGLKNAIDWASRTSEKFKMGQVFTGKYAAIMSASPGSFGGIRSLAHLRGILSILQIHVMPAEIAVSFVADKFDGDSYKMTDEKMEKILHHVGSSLVETLKKTHPAD